MSWGILEMLGSVTILMVAVPPAFAGATLLLGGNLAVGAGLLTVALGMVAADQYITTPGDLPVLVASKFVGIVARQPDEEE
jgi:hypothetical protein